MLDEGRAFGGAVLGVLQRAFPFQHRPAVVAVLCELGEDAAEIDLAVAQRTEAAGPVDPALIARIDALAAVRVELGVLHMEGLDALVIDVDEGEVVELLQKEMRRVVVDVAALVALHRVEEHLEGGAVEHVLARMDLEADVDAGGVIGVEDRLPAAAELGKRLVDQAGRALRPRIEIGKGERAGERDRSREPEMLRRLGGVHDLLDRPFLPRLWIVVVLRGSERVEAGVVGRMHGDELALQMRRKLGDLDAGVLADALHLVAIGFRAGRLVEVEQARVPARYLDALVAEARRPFGDRRQAVERRGITRELCEKYRGTLHRGRHVPLLGCRFAPALSILPAGYFPRRGWACKAWSAAAGTIAGPPSKA